MGPLDLSGALTLVLAAAFQGEPQPSPADLDRAAWEQHRACVVSERVHRFLGHLEVADAGERAKVALELGRARARSAGSAWTPTLEDLRRAESLIADSDGVPADDPAATGLDELAGALELLAIPGAFECASEGLGDPITVQVRSLYHVAVGGDFVLELRWRSRDGREIAARREPIGEGAVAEQGFPMYLRSPLSEQGPWQLYGVVGRPSSGELAGAVAEIRVDAVERLRERARAALAKDLPPDPGLFHLRVALDRLLRSGRRLSCALGAGEIVATIEAWTETGPPLGAFVPLEKLYTDARGVEHWSWTYSPAEEPVRAIAILASSYEASDHVFAGRVGARWLEMAERTRSQLFSFHVPPDAAQVASALARARKWMDGRELLVVARGDAVARLDVGTRGASLELLDGVVVSGGSTAGATGLFARWPRLVIAPGAASAKGESEFQGAEGSPFSMLDDLDLPSQVERWIGSRPAAPEARERGK